MSPEEHLERPEEQLERQEEHLECPEEQLECLEAHVGCQAEHLERREAPFTCRCTYHTYLAAISAYLDVFTCPRVVPRGGVLKSGLVGCRPLWRVVGRCGGLWRVVADSLDRRSDRSCWSYRIHHRRFPNRKHLYLKTIIFTGRSPLVAAFSAHRCARRDCSGLNPPDNFRLVLRTVLRPILTVIPPGAH